MSIPEVLTAFTIPDRLSFTNTPAFLISGFVFFIRQRASSGEMNLFESAKTNPRYRGLYRAIPL